MAFSLVLGVFFGFPSENYKILSDISAATAFADTIPDSNSQIALIANPSTYPKNDNPSIDSDSTVNIVSDSAILSTGGGLPSLSLGNNPNSNPLDDISVYVVKQGDTLSEIAQMFGVSVNTILWANDMKKGDTISPGDVLSILPISGLEYTVLKGDTLQNIAKKYNADINDIVLYNGLASNTAVVSAGDELIIPNAEKSDEGDKPLQNLSDTIANSNKYYQSHPNKNLSGYYVNPVPGYRLSQGIHDNNAVDLAIASGTPIHAAASGIVLIAKSGCVMGPKNCGGGFGNYVVINHPNGTQTLYAHQSKVIVSAGQEVSQGQIIGYVGSTGHSTGYHLHFEVHGARNPAIGDSWKE